MTDVPVRLSTALAGHYRIERQLGAERFDGTQGPRETVSQTLGPLTTAGGATEADR